MENVNIGIVSLILSEKLKNSYFDGKNINESKEKSGEFLNEIKSSSLLQLEFKVLNNIESMFADNDVLATRYIDNNIRLFETYTINELKKERTKILKHYDKNIVLNENNPRVILYNAVNILIEQSLLPSEDVDVDVLHENFTIVLNHIKTPISERKNVIDENINIDNINDNIIEIAINKFNEKYSSLNEEDKKLLIKLIKYSDEQKKTLFEEYKKEGLSLLTKIQDESVVNKKDVVIEKVRNMVYDQKTVNESILKLHELKSGLL